MVFGHNRSRNSHSVAVSDRILWHLLEDILADMLVIYTNVGVTGSCIWEQRHRGEFLIARNPTKMPLKTQKTRFLL